MRAFFGLLLAAGAARAATPTTLPPDAVEFFEKKIRPVLVAECQECHGAAKQKGGLRLDYRDGWKAGGDSGAAIVPGDAKAGLFLKTIRHEDPDLKMPSKAPKLSDTVIADFEKWIAMGAPDPRNEPPQPTGDADLWEPKVEERRKWWSFQPVRRSEVPSPRAAEWSAHPVDRFLVSKMEERGLPPSPDGDARVIYRRLSYALTGLPPSTDDVAQFETAAKLDLAGAVEAAADRLLASPAFGERWARHWMDLMRYAETHGSEGDPEIPEAWRYRDYLIRAFNDDVPFDQFIREHLAGDLLPKPRWNAAEGWNESMLGTANLRLVEHGFMPVDTLDEQVKTIDNQIDVISKSFLGLTVSCARCHDHKFDPISQRDFTAMFGVLASVRPAQVTIDAPELLQRNREQLAALKPRIQQMLGDAWKSAASKVGAQLLNEPRRQAELVALRDKIDDAERQLADLNWSVRRRVAPTANQKPQAIAPAPLARWAFDGDASDSLGKLHAELVDGATIRNGRLVLDGRGAFARTGLTSFDLREKTLEAWVSLSTLDQGGGGALSIETLRQHGFDSIVFAEKDPRQWMAGSNFGIRSRRVGGPSEDDLGKVVHLAIVYRADDSIALYRNGRPYGQAYTQDSLLQYAVDDARVLFGLRHTGAGNGFLAGEIEEARLYGRALSAAEVAASHQAGTADFVSPAQMEAAFTTEEQTRRSRITELRDGLRKELVKLTPGGKDERDPWRVALEDAAKNPANPLAAWAHLSRVAPGQFRAEWQRWVERERKAMETLRNEQQAKFTMRWDLRGADYPQWFRHGGALGPAPVSAGAFAIESQGDPLIRGVFPGGAMTHALSPRHNGVLASPRFKITTDSISVRVGGTGGAQVRVIVDHYPLGANNNIFVQATIAKLEPTWIRLDTAYRKGSWAYLEFTTDRDATRNAGKPKESPIDGSSWFSVDRVVFHDGKEPPADERSGAALVLAAKANSLEELADHYVRLIAEAAKAFRAGAITEAQREFLDFFVRRGLLPTTLPQLPEAGPIIAEYRKLMDEVPVPRRAPGVLEAEAIDAPFMPRGDHLKPGDPVPRGFLAVLDNRPFAKDRNARLEFADAITHPRNPLTARVLVNRVWHHIFGRGIVPTVDNFGRLGEAPTHPELLDYLAARFVEEGWSVKRLVRMLVTTRAFRLSSQPSTLSMERDAANELLSHARVRRLDAESLRDTLMTISGDLERKMYGPPEPGNAPRRSIYLSVRRTALNPFLGVFDAPKPFTTLGRRDATNVPAQSLALLNDPFVIRCATQWAQRSVKATPDADLATRLSDLFQAAISRAPSDAERTLAAAYAAELQGEHGIEAAAVARSVPLLRDLAQSVFNLKEFLYLR
jgi:hypothetical protein